MLFDGVEDLSYCLHQCSETQLLHIYSDHYFLVTDRRNSLYANFLRFIFPLVERSQNFFNKTVKAELNDVILAVVSNLLLYLFFLGYI